MRAPGVGLASTMLSAVGLCLCVLGTLGATFATWQLFAWGVLRSTPVLAEAWLHAGLTGELFVALFEGLPLWLALGVAFHTFVAWVGYGLWWRRPSARRAAIGFAFGWAALALAGYAGVWYALDDLQRGFPERAAFAAAVKVLALQVSLINVGLSAGLLLLLNQPGVRAQFPPYR